MMIKRVQFDKLTFAPDPADPVEGVHSAVIILTTDQATLCLLARVAMPRDAAREAVMIGLMQHALRQIRQMPEYRTRQEGVQIADGAMRELRQSA